MARKELNAQELDQVAGGVYYTNVFEGGNGSVYKLGIDSNHLEYTFKRADKDQVMAIINANTVFGRSQEEDDAAIMAALTASGLLTKIE